MDNQRFPLYAGSINQVKNNDLESLLKMNKGKLIKVFLNDSKEFEGILENTGLNYIILSNSNDGKWYIILNNVINFISSLEQINH